MNKRRILLLAVVLGALLGTGLALWRAQRPTSEIQVSAPVSVQCPTSVVQKVVGDSGQRTTDRQVVMNTLPSVVATNVVTQVQPPKPPKPSKSPEPVSYLPNVPKARQVLLANRRIVVEEGRSFPKTFCAAQTPTARGTAPYVVISEKPVNRDVRIQAVANGAKVIGFLPNNALLVEADAEALKNLEEDATFLAAVEYEPMDKIQRRVLEADGASVETTIVLLNPADKDTIATFVTDNGGARVDRAPETGKSVVARVPKAMVATLAKRGEVKWIEQFQRMRVNNYWSAQAPCHNVAPVWESSVLGLTGSGQKLGTLDTGIDTGDQSTMNSDFSGRIAAMTAVAGCPTKDYSGHGTHTAGSLVGTGANSSDKSKLVRGMAYGAQLVVMCAGDTSGSGTVSPPPFDQLFGWSSSYNACIHSDSWGGAQKSYYTELSNELDDYAWKNPHFLPVFAAGNSGTYGWSTCIDQPATAKNCLTVGAAGTANNGASGYVQRASSSSYGPCADGRRKPDILASGVNINSVSKDGGYKLMSGTSMATPITASSVALIRQWLVRDKGYADTKGTTDKRPTAALMKAIVTGGARDMYLEHGDGSTDGLAPNSKQGWGRLFLRETIAPTDGRSVKLYDRIAYSTGSEVVKTIETKAVNDLDVQLTWVDYPSQESAAVNLVNDLDLVLVNERTGETWTLNDHVNNDEGLRIRNAMADKYSIKVRGYAVPYDSTKGGAAALYVRGAFSTSGTRYGGTYTALPKADATDDMTTAAIISGTVACGGPISLANARKRYEFASGCSITATRLVVGNNDYSSQDIVQTGGTVDITGTGDATSTTECPFLLGHWPGIDRAYVMTGGDFYATNGISRLGWDGGGELRIGGETTSARMRLKGLKAGTERSNAGSSLSVLSNGVLEVGASGLTVATANIPVTLAGGTLAVYEDGAISVTDGIALTADSTIDVPKGVRMALKCSLKGDYKVNKTGEGRLMLDDLSLTNKINLVEGTVTGPGWTPPANPVTIDVLVSFEAGAKDYVENDLGMSLEAFSRAQLAKMNSVLPNTELDKCFTFRYVGHTNINVTCNNIGTALYRATYSEDYPEYQPISNLREANGADVVLVMIYPEDSTSGTAGGSYGLQSYEDVEDHSEKAYSVVSVVAAVQQDTSVHEIAHLMGAGHPNKPDPGGQHWKDYSYGYYFTDKQGYRWHTIMGYGTDGGQTYSAIPYFSSPEYTYRGVPVGTLENDNTRTLRESCVGVSQWRPTKYVEPTDAEKAAQKSRSKPVILFDAGTADKPAIVDDWQVHTMNDTRTYSVTKDGVTVSGSTSAKFWKNSTSATFASGSFTDIMGRSWPTVEGEMLVSLGLKGTKEVDLASFFKTGSNVGNGSGTTITVTGLSSERQYVLYYMTCDGTNSKPGSFKLKASGYAGTPTIEYVKGTATSYATGAVGTAVTANPNVPLLVRVTNLRPNAEGKVVIDVGGATINLLAIAEMPPDPSLFYLARQP